MHPNELSNKCYLVLEKTCDVIMSDEMYRGIRPHVSLDADNKTIATACLEFVWLRLGRPDRREWHFDARVEYSIMVLEIFDGLPEEQRRDVSKVDTNQQLS